MPYGSPKTVKCLGMFIRHERFVHGHWRGPVWGPLVLFVGVQAVKSFSSARRRVTRVLGIMVAVSLLSGLSWGPASAAEPGTPGSGETTIPRNPASRKPTPEELENWRQAILKLPRPKGCFTATYPEQQWREVHCTAPPHKLLLPRSIRPEIVGGAGTDFTADVTGHISEAQGSFDPGTVVSSECSVPCPNQVCPTNPSCAAGSANNYSLQLNTEFFQTTTCKNSPNSNPPGTPNNSGCQGWEQFVYEGSSGGTFIQYWMTNYGPQGTSCPAPISASCQNGAQNGPQTDGWCPFSFTPTSAINCVINAVDSVQAPSVPATSLPELILTGDVTDSITVTAGGQIFLASGNNYFPDLGSEWQQAEFNVFGDSGGDQAVFGAGTTVVVRTQVDSGTTIAPSCVSQSFTGESNNLSLVGTPAVVSMSRLPAIVFTESDDPGGTPPTCATSGSGLDCTEVVSSGRTDCRDAGGVPSTCASATCPKGMTLTGGGGACAAGDSKIKSLFPIERQGSFSIVCDQQGVDPQAVAICCHL